MSRKSAKRIRKLISSGGEASAIELTRIASEIESNAMKLEREFDKLGLPGAAPDR